MNTETAWIKQNSPWLLPFLYLFGRLIMFLALFPNDHYGFGDFPVYFDWTALPGWPFIDYWMEYPPLFPFLSEGISRLSGGSVFLYDFLLSLCLALAGAGSIWIFQKIAVYLGNETSAFYRTLVYFGLISALPYTWWYFEFLPVLLMLGGLWAVLQKKDKTAGVWIGLGILAKWFPLFLLPGLLRYRPRKSILKIGAIALALTVIVWGSLYLLSPDMTRASFISQPARGSWQTLWAMIDGNLTTGAFVLNEERTLVEAASFPRGNPAVIPPWSILPLFALLGLLLIWRKNDPSDQDYISLVGITWAIFLLWSPGWSPQWILYLIPLILLSLPLQKSLLINLLLILLTIFEWPLLLKRNLFEALWIIAPLRMGLLVWLIVLWSRRLMIQERRKTSLA